MVKQFVTWDTQKHNMVKQFVTWDTQKHNMIKSCLEKKRK